MKTDKGVAGLTLLLSLIVMLFIIGILVMIFSIMSSKLSDATYDDATATVTNAAQIPSQAGTLLTNADSYFLYTNCQIVSARNGSASGTLIGSGNYTVLSGCLLKNLTTSYPTYNWYVNYTVDYKVANTGTNVINDTASGIAGVTDWFDIFIVIGAMVVLILLVVLIISAIRGSGMIAGESSKGANSIGTA